MTEKQYYVYRHYIENNTFYVGKGSKDRAYAKQRSSKWKEIVGDKEFKVEIVKYFSNNKEAFKFEAELTRYYKSIGQCAANVAIGHGLQGENSPHYGKTLSEEHKIKISKATIGENNPRAKKIAVSVNGNKYVANCKKYMQNILLEECGISASREFLDGKVPKKYKHMIDFIKVEDKIIFKK